MSLLHSSGTRLWTTTGIAHSASSFESWTPRHLHTSLNLPPTCTRFPLYSFLCLPPHSSDLPSSVSATQHQRRELVAVSWIPSLAPSTLFHAANVLAYQATNATLHSCIPPSTFVKPLPSLPRPRSCTAPGHVVQVHQERVKRLGWLCHRCMNALCAFTWVLVQPHHCLHRLRVHLMVVIPILDT